MFIINLIQNITNFGENDNDCNHCAVNTNQSQIFNVMSKETKVAKEETVEIVKTQNYSVKIKSVRVYSQDDNLRYRVQLNNNIVGIAKNGITGEYEETEIDYIDFVPRVLIAQCLERIQGLDTIYTKKKEESLRNGNSSGFGAAELQAVLRDANIVIARTKHEVGEEYVTSSGEVRVHEHSGYSTSVINIDISGKMQSIIDKAVESLLIF